VHAHLKYNSALISDQYSDEVDCNIQDAIGVNKWQVPKNWVMAGMNTMFFSSIVTGLDFNWRVAKMVISLVGSWRCRGAVLDRLVTSWREDEQMMCLLHPKSKMAYFVMLPLQWDDWLLSKGEASIITLLGGHWVGIYCIIASILRSCISTDSALISVGFHIVLNILVPIHGYVHLHHFWLGGAQGDAPSQKWSVNCFRLKIMKGLQMKKVPGYNANSWASNNIFWFFQHVKVWWEIIFASTSAASQKISR
jgi:hypothetical protein